MSKLTTLISVALSAYIILIMTMAGGNKLFPIDPETHSQLVAACKHWPAVFSPLLKHVHLDHLTGDDLRVVIGVSELLAAGALLVSFLLPKWLKVLAMFLLSIIMAGAVHLHVQFGTSIVMPLATLVVVILRMFWFLFSSSSKSKKKTA